jgi:hypothetical protein
MAFKPLTKKGQEFIFNRCLANSAFGNNRFTGKRKFALPKSTLSNSTVFTATPVDESNTPIQTPEELAKNLISWFNRYSELYLLDANIIAAQAYAESGYNLWIYSEGGAMGISQLLDSAIFETIVKNRKEFQVEYDELTTGLSGDTTDIRNYIPSYGTRDGKVKSTQDTIALAKRNRAKLFQNIINMPKIMIKMQCHLMNFIGQRNNNLASSSLYAYNRGGYLTSTSYDDMIIKTQKRYGDEYIKEGLIYVNRIFNLLGGVEPLIPIGFGYDVNYTHADLQGFALDGGSVLSGELTAAQEKLVKSLHPIAQNTFREFIIAVEKNTPFKVIVNSAYRSFSEQERIRKENTAMTPPRPAASPGSSYHNYGLGIDINLNSTTVSLTYGFNSSVKDWEKTGVVKIAEDLGLRWGGYFQDIDTVHFDMGSRYSIDDCYKLAVKKYGNDPTKIQGNHIPLVA